MRTFLIGSMVAFGLCVGINPAESQTLTPTAPPATQSAIYGGAETRNSPTDGLDLSIQAYEAYDDNVLTSDVGGELLPGVPLGSGIAGFYSGVGVQLGYAHSGEHVGFRSWAGSSLAYYPELQDLTSLYHQVGFQLSGRAGRRVTVHGGPFFDYSPQYSLRLLPSLPVFDPNQGPSIPGAIGAPAPDFDYTSVQRNTYRYGANVGVNFAVSERAAVGFDYGNVQTRFDGLTDMQLQGAGAHLGLKLTRNAWLTTGYSRQTARYEGLEPSTSETGNIDIGVHYDKPLSVTRRTSLRFSTGAASGGDNDHFLGMQAVGSASLVHQIGRTWGIGADYTRGLGYIEGFDRPVFSDSAGAGLGGLISRRVELSAGARYFAGAIGLTATAPSFDTYAAWARIRTGLTRTLAAFAEYRFYRYEFPDAAARPIGMPAYFHRNGVRVGLSLWVPLVK